MENCAADSDNIIEMSAADLKARKEIIVDCLKLGTFEIEFLKVNGEKSWMLCTLHPGVIPTYDADNTASEKDSVVTVYSPDRRGWRAFKTLNLISMVPV